jgi:hypothetical protein
VVPETKSYATPEHFSVSVIIPSYCTALECESVLDAVGCQSLLPEEVVLIRVGAVYNRENDYWNAWSKVFVQQGLTLKVVEEESTLFPGAARNLGLRYTTKQWIAFLDVETIPCEHWLEEQVKRIEATSSLGCFGFTTYAASSSKQGLVRDAIYGRRSIKTLPGSVLRRDLFGLLGQFIPNIRAAEDTEWMIRAKTMGVKIENSSHEALISYKGLTKLGLRELAKKWRRNYLSSRQLQHLKVQTTIVWLLFYAVASLIAFNWNAIVAGWQVESPLYIDHVTKIVSLTPIGLYIFFRGCYLPFKRGVPLSNIFPLRFVLLAVVGAFLDVVKVYTIFVPRERR